MAAERILFVTGRLAESSLRRVVQAVSLENGFAYEIRVLGITVAALMHTNWLARKLTITESFDRVLLPGYCQGDLEPLIAQFGIAFERGPKDLFDLPQFFGQADREPIDLSHYDIEILAEINHAPRLTDEALLAAASGYRDNGADVIDLGCIPGESWNDCGRVTRLLREEGFRVSIDSFDRAEVESAVNAGAELILSCNSSNVDWVSGLGVEVVAIPDTPNDSASLLHTVEELDANGIRFRVDPILEPIGFGFGESLARYWFVRQRLPEVEIMMGVANLTELTEVDSAGVNFLLAALCQEWGVRSVLTTEVINWCRTAVREFDIARRILSHSFHRQMLPKHIDSSLVLLRDAAVNERGMEEFENLAETISDPNYRLFAEQGELHVINRDGYWRGRDPFEVFDQMTADRPPLEPSHAFYLGYELCKAMTALLLGKQYTQDEALRWGFLTEQETSAVERRKRGK